MSHNVNEPTIQFEVPSPLLHEVRGYRLEYRTPSEAETQFMWVVAFNRNHALLQRKKSWKRQWTKAFIAD